jgi:N-formylglutamate amidohydrolase
MLNALFEMRYTSPIIATAIHNGHYIRPELKDNLIISDEDRKREEDPYTNSIIRSYDNRIVVNTSRFEVELNRNRDRAIYKTPDDCWGLEVWKRDLTQEEIDQSLAEYDSFYRRLDSAISETIRSFGYAIVLDVHSYNHHRLGIGQPYDSPEDNPQIILGTNNMPRRYMESIYKIQKKFQENIYEGRKLDCRIDIKYPGGTMSRHLHREFPDKVFSLAIEFKKTFMNEWTGELYRDKMEDLITALQSISPLLNKDLLIED